jgi:hypothetical protein
VVLLRFTALDPAEIGGDMRDMRILRRIFDVDAAEAEILAATYGFAELQPVSPRDPAPPAKPVLRFWPDEDRMAA